jgi:hypothetical protein
MSVYVITARDVGMAKIGYSNAPKRRLALLQTGSPAKLILEAVIPASRENEKQLHEAFSKSRGHCEWFKINADMESLIEAFPASFARKMRVLADTPLGNWMTANRVTTTALAVSLNITPASVSRILNGLQMPRPEVMRAIATHTQGQVTANHFYGQAA